MQFYLISDNVDTKMGMRLAGIEGIVVHEESEVHAALEKVFVNPDIAIVLVTEKLVKLCGDYIYHLKLTREKPLIVEIPDRHATSQITNAISRYVQEAIGISI